LLKIRPLFAFTVIMLLVIAPVAARTIRPPVIVAPPLKCWCRESQHAGADMDQADLATRRAILN